MALPQYLTNIVEHKAFLYC